LCTTPAGPARTHYAALGVHASSTPDEIKRAYYQLARQTHPDATGSSSAVPFAEVSTAYEVLSSPLRRQAYDLALSSASVAATLDGAAASERIGALVRGGDLGAALGLFLQVQSARPSVLSPQTGAALLTLCTRRAHMRPAAVVYAHLRDGGALGADACNAWFGACIKHGRTDEAMATCRYMEAHDLEQDDSMRATMRQIRTYARRAAADQQSDATGSDVGASQPAAARDAAGGGPGGDTPVM
jgi:pentatricopeptide repeat protein